MQAWKWAFCLLVVLILASGIILSCGDDDDDDDNDDNDDDNDTGDDDDDDDDDVMIKVSGNAFLFNQGERIEGTTVTILEFPDKTTTTGEEGYFEFLDMPAGEEATFILTDDEYPTTQTKTFTLPETDLEQVTFQVPDWTTYEVLEAILGITADDTKCQMVTTITRVGKSLYDSGAHGEEGAVMFSDPVIPAEHGPTYFDSTVLPNASLTESSDDGGVVFTNVDPGIYTWSAEKDGVEFEEIVMNCRAGVLVNASPPYGLQALE